MCLVGDQPGLGESRHRETKIGAQAGLLSTTQIGSEEYSLGFVRDENCRGRRPRKAFALHGSKPATRKDCIG